jgi:hypothetical protein
MFACKAHEMIHAPINGNVFARSLLKFNQIPIISKRQFASWPAALTPWEMNKLQKVITNGSLTRVTKGRAFIRENP